MSITKSEWEKQYLGRIPESYKGLFKRAYSGKSKASSLKAKCLDCVSFQRKEVELCEATTCPLWKVRPYKVKGEISNANLTDGLKERPKKVLSDEHKAKMAKGRKSTQKEMFNQ